jgi:hypothetical protein
MLESTKLWIVVYWALDQEGVWLVGKAPRERKLSTLRIPRSDEQERRVAVRTINLGPREGGVSIHSSNTSMNMDLDGIQAVFQGIVVWEIYATEALV